MLVNLIATQNDQIEGGNSGWNYVISFIINTFDKQREINRYNY